LRRVLLFSLPLLLTYGILAESLEASRDRGSPQSAQNPFDGQPEAIRAGKKLYLRNCSHCHGEDALGRKRAANLRRPAVLDAPPGVLFLRIRNGNLREGMPAWSHLSDQRIWQIISYIQSLDEQSESE